MLVKAIRTLCWVAIAGTTATAVAEDRSPRSVSFTISVIERLERERPFASVGLFKVFLGDSVYDRGQCPSKSNSKGVTTCRIICDPQDSQELTLVLRPPGSDAVPGYEVPVSQELSLLGCRLDSTQLSFAYTPLELALRETLSADPELRQIVASREPTVTFAALKPFEESQSALAAYVERNPDNPQLARYARILHDASITGQARAIDPAVAVKVQKLSVGTESIYVHAAAKRSLGPDKARQIAPITTDAARLRTNTTELGDALARKPDKTASELMLHKELSRVHSMESKPTATAPTIEWHKVMRAGPR